MVKQSSATHGAAPRALKKVRPSQHTATKIRNIYISPNPILLSLVHCDCACHDLPIDRAVAFHHCSGLNLFIHSQSHTLSAPLKDPHQSESAIPTSITSTLNRVSLTDAGLFYERQCTVNRHSLIGGVPPLSTSLSAITLLVVEGLGWILVVRFGLSKGRLFAAAITRSLTYSLFPTWTHSLRHYYQIATRIDCFAVDCRLWQSVFCLRQPVGYRACVATSRFFGLTSIWLKTSETGYIARLQFRAPVYPRCSSGLVVSSFLSGQRLH